MKREKWQSCLIGFALAFLLSIGGVGCLVTGFDLNIGSMAVLWLACGFFAAVSALCFQLKWGGTVVLCLMALASGFLWYNGQAVDQLTVLIYQISYIYDKAYDCGIVDWGASSMTYLQVGYPLGILGCLIATCVSWTVCRRRPAVLAVGLSIMPLMLCVVVTDTVPKEGYLYILLLALIVLILTNHLRRNSLAQSITLTYMVILPVALALGILFLAVPQEGYVNPTLELQKDVLAWAEDLPLLLEDLTEDFSGEQGTANAAEVDLEDLGPRKEYTYPVMDVTGAQTGTLYLREQDYDLYDGSGWTSIARRAETFGAEASAIIKTVGTVTVSTRRGKDVMYLPYYPANQMGLAGGKVSNDTKGKRYEFVQQVLPENWRELIAVSEEDGRIEFTIGTQSADGGGDNRYLVLPNDTKADAQALLKDILTDQRTTTEKADAIAAYVRSSAEYDLDTAKMPADGGDFALWFLKNSETGYCVHFATATTVLLRAAGIPARYVTGYMTQAVAGESVTITAAEAHAWAEYYEPRLGMWIVLESTPADPDDEPIADPTETETGEATEETTETDETVPSETEETLSETTAPDPTVPSGEGEQPEQPRETPAWLRGLITGALILGAAVLAVVSQRYLRLQYRRKGLYRGKANAKALARWREAVLLSRLLKKTPPGELEKLAQKAKFSQHILTAEELAAFDAYLRTARQACREKPWYLQLVYQYIFAAY